MSVANGTVFGGVPTAGVPSSAPVIGPSPGSSVAPGKRGHRHVLDLYGLVASNWRWQRRGALPPGASVPPLTPRPRPLCCVCSGLHCWHLPAGGCGHLPDSGSPRAEAQGPHALAGAGGSPRGGGGDGSRGSGCCCGSSGSQPLHHPSGHCAARRRGDAGRKMRQGLGSRGGRFGTRRWQGRHQGPAAAAATAATAATAAATQRPKQPCTAIVRSAPAQLTGAAASQPASQTLHPSLHVCIICFEVPRQPLPRSCPEFAAFSAPLPSACASPILLCVHLCFLYPPYSLPLVLCPAALLPLLSFP